MKYCSVDKGVNDNIKIKKDTHNKWTNADTIIHAFRLLLQIRMWYGFIEGNNYRIQISQF